MQCFACMCVFAVSICNASTYGSTAKTRIRRQILGILGVFCILHAANKKIDDTLDYYFWNMNADQKRCMHAGFQRCVQGIVSTSRKIIGVYSILVFFQKG